MPGLSGIPFCCCLQSRAMAYRVWGCGGPFSAPCVLCGRIPITFDDAPDRLARVQDDIGTACVKLGLAIEQHQPGYVDAFFGPGAWKTRAEIEGKLPLTELSARAQPGTPH